MGSVGGEVIPVVTGMMLGDGAWGSEVVVVEVDE